LPPKAGVLTGNPSFQQANIATAFGAKKYAPLLGGQNYVTGKNQGNEFWPPYIEGNAYTPKIYYRHFYPLLHLQSVTSYLHHKSDI
jgi:hypothetical protein